MTAPKVVF